MAFKLPKKSTGMIIDGVFGSAHVDSSGEVLDIDGADISSLDTDGVFVYEHKAGDKEREADGKKIEGNNGEEIAGKILYTKKVFSAKDCETDREKMYWEKVHHVPFIYGVGRLYDGAGHSGAQALAAQIRDHYANGEPLLVRFSVEGSTLDKKDNVLRQTVIRRVAVTLKPCNRTAVSGLVSDPNAPAGFDKQPVKDGEDLLASVMGKRESDDPRYQRLGGSVEIECSPMLEVPGWRMEKAIKAYAKLLVVKKALAAGSYAGAPGSLTGGAALQVEDRGLKARAMAAHRDYDGARGNAFKKGEFRAFLKAKLPEVSDGFLDHFSDLVDEHEIKLGKLKKALDLEGDRPAKEHQGLGWAPKPDEPEQPKRRSWLGKPDPGQKVAGVGKEGAKNRTVMHPDGTLQTPKGERLSIHIPDSKEYLSILHPHAYDISDIDREHYLRTVHQPWERAMQNWMELNKAARERRLPRSIIKLAGLFAAMSPNTGVALQERHYGHLMDMLHEGVMNLQEPVTQDHIAEFERRAQGPELPKWNREFYEKAGPPPGVDSWEEAAVRDAQPNKFGNEKNELPQINGLRHLDDIMPHLEHLFAEHGDDARSMAGKLMDMKSEYKRRATAQGARAAKESMEGVHPTVHGFGPKLTRYMLSMAGGGNIIVPDRHMTRSMFNLAADDPMSDYLATKFVTQAKNEPFLRALDQHFFHKHPAVQHVLQKYPEHFKGHEEQAVFPAFWLHWLHIPHYEKNQGRYTEAQNASTDHRVFWDSVQEAMRRHGIPVRGDFYDYQPEDTSFDFGANAVAKSDHTHPWAHHDPHTRALGVLLDMKLRHGDSGMLAGYYAHVAPWLTRLERQRGPEELVRKFEVATAELRKSLRTIRDDAAERDPLRRTRFAGRTVVPGWARTADGDYDLLHEDEHHYYAHPQGKPLDAHELVRLPKEKQGEFFRVYRRPASLVFDLDQE